MTHRHIFTLTLLAHIDTSLAGAIDVACEMRALTGPAGRRDIGLAAYAPDDGVRGRLEGPTVGWRILESGNGSSVPEPWRELLGGISPPMTSPYGN